MLEKNIRILQINVNGSIAATENILDLAIQLKIDIICAQEPWLTAQNTPIRPVEGQDTPIGPIEGQNAPMGAHYAPRGSIGPTDTEHALSQVSIGSIGHTNNHLDTIDEEPEIPYMSTKSYDNTRSINHSSYRQIIPKPENKAIRPRVITWIRKDLEYRVQQGPLEHEPDAQFLDIIEGNKSFRLINLYNEKDLATKSSYTLERTILRDKGLLEADTILLGDFNLHHPNWDLNYTPNNRAYQFQA